MYIKGETKVNVEFLRQIYLWPQECEDNFENA
jgi:hypothetical protein